MQAKLKKVQKENEKLRWTFHPSSIVRVISKSLTNLQTKPDRSNSYVARIPSYAGKPYGSKQRPSTIFPAVGGSLDPDMTWLYCKDTGHRKDNHIWLNHMLAQKLQISKGIVPETDIAATNTQPNWNLGVRNGQTDLDWLFPHKPDIISYREW